MAPGPDQPPTQWIGEQMSLENPTYRERMLSIKSKIDTAMMAAVHLKEDLECEVDRLADRSKERGKPMSTRTHERYLVYAEMVDVLDHIVGHLSEAEHRD